LALEVQDNLIQLEHQQHQVLLQVFQQLYQQVVVEEQVVEQLMLLEDQVEVELIQDLLMQELQEIHHQ
jgi:hypothetical protein